MLHRFNAMLHGDSFLRQLQSFLYIIILFGKLFIPLQTEVYKYSKYIFRNSKKY